MNSILWKEKSLKFYIVCMVSTWKCKNISCLELQRGQVGVSNKKIININNERERGGFLNIKIKNNRRAK